MLEYHLNKQLKLTWTYEWWNQVFLIFNLLKWTSSNDEHIKKKHTHTQIGIDHNSLFYPGEKWTSM